MSVTGTGTMVNRARKLMAESAPATTSTTPTAMQPTAIAPGTSLPTAPVKSVPQAPSLSPPPEIPTLEPTATSTSNKTPPDGFNPIVEPNGPNYSGPAVPPPSSTNPPVPPTGQTTPSPTAVNPPPNAARQVQIMDWRPGYTEFNRDAVTREVQGDELTSRQLERLLDENGRYIQSARLRAREGAQASGMLFSSIAAGAGERAAIDAGAPIAQADANVYAATAADNMRARNEDALADQGQGRQLMGQEMGLRAQLEDARAGRDFQSQEAFSERGWRSSEEGLNRDFNRDQQNRQFEFQGTQAGYDRNLQRDLQAGDFDFRRTEAATERDWRDATLENEQAFQSEQNQLTRRQDAFNQYVTLLRSREEQLSQQLAAIFSNTALKPDQQQRAAENARSVFRSLATSFNAIFAQGIPEIFYNPYPMGPNNTQPPPPTPPPPPPIAGPFNGSLFPPGTTPGGNNPTPPTGPTPP